MHKAPVRLPGSSQPPCPGCEEVTWFSARCLALTCLGRARVQVAVRWGREVGARPHVVVVPHPRGWGLRWLCFIQLRCAVKGGGAALLLSCVFT